MIIKERLYIEIINQIELNIHNCFSVTKLVI